MEQKTFDPDGVGVDNGTYFGLPFEPETAELVIVSAPWDVTVSYGAGTAYAPDAIIEASTQLDFHEPLAPGANPMHGRDCNGAIASLSSVAICRVNEGCVAMNANIGAQAARWLDAGKLVGLVGGDHSTPYGLIRALGERHAEFGILHIDAHCDLRDAYEGFEFSHASIMFNVLRDVPAVTKIAQVAVRDFSEREAALAASSGRVLLFDDLSLAAAGFRGETWDAQCLRIVETLPQEVYVSFDIDGLSYENCPHTGTPVAGGLGFNQAVWLLDTLVRSGRRIVGFDVVEVTPAREERIDAITGARVLWKLCNLTLKSNVR